MSEEPAAKRSGFSALDALAIALIATSIGLFSTAVAVDTELFKGLLQGGTAMTFFGGISRFLGKWIGASTSKQIERSNEKVDAHTEAILLAIRSLGQATEFLNEQNKVLLRKHEAALAEFKQANEELRAEIVKLQTRDEDSGLELADLLIVSDNHGDGIEHVQKHLAAKDPDYKPFEVRKRDPAKLKNPTRWPPE